MSAHDELANLEAAVLDADADAAVRAAQSAHQHASAQLRDDLQA